MKKGMVRFMLLITVGTGHVALAQDPETRGMMGPIFDDIKYLLPRSFNQAGWPKPEDRQETDKRIKSLADKAKALEAHGLKRGPGFQFVAASLQRDVGRLQTWYQKGAMDEATFTLHNLTENCISCHSSLPEGAPYPKVDSFLKDTDQSQLSLIEKAQILVMGRQFDAALLKYEEFLKDPRLHPMTMVVTAAFYDYLKICVQTKLDLKRPQQFLTEMLSRPQLPLHIKRQMELWMKHLKSLDEKGSLQKVDLKVARSLLDDARKVMEYPRDRDGLMYHLVASSILNRYTVQHPSPSLETAEAFYLLAVAEGLLEHSIWIQRSEYDLEVAIRMAPQAPFAQKAFALLEERYLVGYSGSRGTQIPEEITQTLDELRSLIQNPKQQTMH